jgi:hypothetical protein
LKKSFELEDTFRSLNHIPRSQFSKRKTYHAIIQQNKPPSPYRALAHNWSGLLLTFAMLIFCISFLYTQIVSPAGSHQSSVKPADSITAGDVIMTYVSRSDSDHYFSLKTSNLTMPGILGFKDQEWMETLNKALIGMEETSVKLSGKAAFDLLVIFEGREPAKLKLWVSGNDLYVKQFNSSIIFKIKSVQAQKMINTLSYLQKQVQF